MLFAIALMLEMALNYSCLVDQVIIEAENQGFRGMSGVAAVIRQRSIRSGSGYCAVIAAPHQFGWRKTSPSLKTTFMATMASLSPPPKGCENAIHFDEHGSEHRWASKLPVACRINGHTFYEEDAWRG